MNNRTKKQTQTTKLIVLFMKNKLGKKLLEIMKIKSQKVNVHPKQSIEFKFFGEEIKHQEKLSRCVFKQRLQKFCDIIIVKFFCSVEVQTIG